MRLHRLCELWVQMWIWCEGVLEVMKGLAKDFYFPVLVMAEVVSQKMYRHW